MFKWLIALFRLTREMGDPEREDAPASKAATPVNVPSGKIVQMKAKADRKRRAPKPDAE